MFATIRFRIGAMPAVRIGLTEKSIPPLIVALPTLWECWKFDHR